MIEQIDQALVTIWPYLTVIVVLSWLWFGYRYITDNGGASDR